MLKVETLVKRALKRVKLPGTVAETRFELGEDPWGWRYVYFWIILRDGLPESAWSQKTLRPMREGLEKTIETSLRNAGLDWSVYTAFRAQSEQDEIDAETVTR